MKGGALVDHSLRRLLREEDVRNAVFIANNWLLEWRHPGGGSFGEGRIAARAENAFGKKLFGC